MTRGRRPATIILPAATHNPPSFSSNEPILHKCASSPIQGCREGHGSEHHHGVPLPGDRGDKGSTANRGCPLASLPRHAAGNVDDSAHALSHSSGAQNGLGIVQKLVQSLIEPAHVQSLHQPMMSLYVQRRLRKQKKAVRKAYSFLTASLPPLRN